MKLLETIDEIILDEAIKDISLIRKYEGYMREPLVVQQIDGIIDRLKSLTNFIGTNRNGKRLYFRTDYEGNAEKKDKSYAYYVIQMRLDDYKYYISPKLYKDGYAKDSSGRQVKIGKILNMLINKAESEGRKEYFRDLLQKYNQDPMRLQGQMSKNKKLIVMSTANYDIMGMTQGRSWQQDSCMRLDSEYNQGSRFVHCDIQYGTIVVYLINEDDKNIENPLGRVLVKPYLNFKDHTDVYYAADKKEYGGQTGFGTLIDDIFRDLQDDKEGKFVMNQNLSAQGRNVVHLGSKILTQKIVNDYMSSDEFKGSIHLSNTVNNEYEYVKVISDVEILDRGVSYFAINEFPNLESIDNLHTNMNVFIDYSDKLTKLTNINSESFFKFNKCDNVQYISGKFDRDLSFEEMNIHPNLDLSNVIFNTRWTLEFDRCELYSLPKLPPTLKYMRFSNCSMMDTLPKIIGDGGLVISFSVNDESELPIIPENRNYTFEIE
jgi:hypothetical protein